MCYPSAQSEQRMAGNEPLSRPQVRHEGPSTVLLCRDELLFRLRVGFQHRQELFNANLSLVSPAQWMGGVDPVMVKTALLGYLDVALVLQVADDSAHRAHRDAKQGSDGACGNLLFLVEQSQHCAVVRDEGPA